ncbi:hypothetical protein [Sharpea azabuensis]
MVRNTKTMPEKVVQLLLADYIRIKYPTVIFHSDYGSGLKMTMGQAKQQARMSGGIKGYPDMFIAEPKGKYHGLFIELKKEGVKIYKKDGLLVANEHIREQARMLDRLTDRGYRAEFAVGLDEAKKMVDSYLK